MARRHTATSDAAILAQADRILAGFPSFGARLPRSLSRRAIGQALAAFRGYVRATEAAELAYHDLVGRKHEARATLERMLQRIRQGVSFHYGDDSKELALAGGTPISRRKRPSRKRPRTRPEAA